MVSVEVCDMVFVRNGAPRLYPGAPSLALQAIHLAPQGAFSCLAGNSPCTPAGEAGFSRFASETPNSWNDNENALKRRTIAPANSACSFEQTRPNPRTRDSDAKYKTKTEDVPVLGLQTVQNGRKKEPCFRTAPQKFISADIHLRTARQARLHARGCLLQCRSCCP